MQGEREGDPSSSQNLPAATACFSSLPLSQWKSKPNQQRMPL